MCKSDTSGTYDTTNNQLNIYILNKTNLLHSRGLSLYPEGKAHFGDSKQAKKYFHFDLLCI